ncbi:MAG: hypothetical protein ACHRXM_16700 [Isosphaerales bacterium]
MRDSIRVVSLAMSLVVPCCLCGTRLEATSAVADGPGVKPITSFEDGNPFSGGVLVEMHATTGRRALRIDSSYVSLDQPQNWLGYDFLKADLFTDSRKPLNLDVEIRDTETRDYWTRVNYSTIVPPGKSTLIVPVKQLYVGGEGEAGADVEPERNHPAGVRDRRKAGRPAVPGQPAPGA